MIILQEMTQKSEGRKELAIENLQISKYDKRCDLNHVKSSSEDSNLFTRHKRKKLSPVIYSKMTLRTYLSQFRRSKLFMSSSFISIFLSD